MASLENWNDEEQASEEETAKQNEIVEQTILWTIDELSAAEKQVLFTLIKGGEAAKAILEDETKRVIVQRLVNLRLLNKYGQAADEITRDVIISVMILDTVATLSPQEILMLSTIAVNKNAKDVLEADAATAIIQKFISLGLLKNTDGQMDEGTRQLILRFIVNG